MRLRITTLSGVIRVLKMEGIEPSSWRWPLDVESFLRTMISLAALPERPEDGPPGVLAAETLERSRPCT